VSAPAPEQSDKTGMKLTSKILKENIGNVIEWESHHDARRGTCSLNRGVITDVQGKNVSLDGDWRWFPDFINAKISARSEMKLPDEKEE
jgi:hypothetical protein